MRKIKFSFQYSIFILVIQRFLSFKKYLKLTPYLEVNEIGRNNERKRLLSWVVLTLGIAKMGSLAMWLIGTPPVATLTKSLSCVQESSLHKHYGNSPAG